MLAAGSRGDYQPVLAVGRGLAARGHDVGVTATSDFVELVGEAGVRAEEVAVDAMGYYRDDALRQGMPVGLAAQMELLRDVARVLAPAVRATMTDLLPRYDALVTTAMTSAWAGMVGGARRPQVLMMFAPAIPSAWGDSSLFSVRAGRSVHNLAAGVRALGPAMRLASADPAATRRERLRGLRQLATAPVFVANSAQIVTPRRVGGRLVRTTGYPFRDLPHGSALPVPVADFLAAGAPPVYVGLGSHTVPAVREALRHTVDAVLSLGHRAVVQRGSGLEDLGGYVDGYGDQVLFVGDVPHELLFPASAAVVPAPPHWPSGRRGRRSCCRSPWTSRSSPGGCTRSGWDLPRCRPQRPHPSGCAPRCGRPCAPRSCSAPWRWVAGSARRTGSPARSP